MPFEIWVEELAQARWYRKARRRQSRFAVELREFPHSGREIRRMHGGREFERCLSPLRISPRRAKHSKQFHPA